jgi:hypothetical protein
MQSQHYMLIAIALIAGYAIARFFPQAGDAVGLPK